MSALVVDDNATNRRILVELLASWGMRPMATANGAERRPRGRGRSRPLSLALIDMNIAGASGCGGRRGAASAEDCAATADAAADVGRPAA